MSLLLVPITIWAYSMAGPEHVWTSPEAWIDFQSILYAEVVEAKQVNAASWSYRLKPLATITGTMDPAYIGELTAWVNIGPSAATHIGSAPSKGKKVLVIVVRHQGADWMDYIIPGGDAPFFPIDSNGYRPALTEVTGFDDPKVTETVENLRKLRGKQREEAEKKAAAEKQPSK